MSEIVEKIAPDGTRLFMLDRYGDGSTTWDNGELHRLDGPAVIRPDGSQEWYVNGGRHREDGPAVIWNDGDEEWYAHGQHHRLDGPAIIGTDGSQKWLVNGMLHRLDGPAVIREDGSQGWYVNDNEITDKVLEWIDQIGLPPWEQWGDTEKTLFKVSFAGVGS